jgi:hypothetical protein
MGEKFQYRSDYGPEARALIRALVMKLCDLDSRGIEPIPEWMRPAFHTIAANGSPAAIDSIIEKIEWWKGEPLLPRVLLGEAIVQND